MNSTPLNSSAKSSVLILRIVNAALPCSDTFAFPSSFPLLRALLRPRSVFCLYSLLVIPLLAGAAVPARYLCLLQKRGLAVVAQVPVTPDPECSLVLSVGSTECVRLDVFSMRVEDLG